MKPTKTEKINDIKIVLIAIICVWLMIAVTCITIRLIKFI